MKDIIIEPVWKDNDIISITIRHKVLKMKIKLFDSFHFINSSLDDMFGSACACWADARRTPPPKRGAEPEKTFECVVKKGKFPYKFVNKNKLFYIGNKPDISYYENISKEDYNNIINHNWNIKDETLKYLNSDITGLLEALLKFNKNIFLWRSPGGA
jgi:DNA polymerase type B, organellar and viral